MRKYFDELDYVNHRDILGHFANYIFETDVQCGLEIIMLEE